MDRISSSSVVVVAGWITMVIEPIVRRRLSPVSDGSMNEVADARETVRRENARDYHLVDTVIIVIVIVIASRNLIAARRDRRGPYPVRRLTSPNNNAVHPYAAAERRRRGFRVSRINLLSLISRDRLLDRRRLAITIMERSLGLRIWSQDSFCRGSSRYWKSRYSAGNWRCPSFFNKKEHAFDNADLIALRRVAPSDRETIGCDIVIDTSMFA